MVVNLLVYVDKGNFGNFPLRGKYPTHSYTWHLINIELSPRVGIESGN